MKAASRDSYAVAVERLDAYAADASPELVATVAGELRSFAALLVREPRLRRALADSTRTDEARVGLVRSLVDGKVGADTLDLLTAVVGRRWSTPADLLEGLERLAVEAILAAAERERVLGDVEDELFRFAQVVKGTPRLAAVLGDHTVDPARRAALVRDLLGAKARSATVRLAEIAVDGFGGRGFEAGLDRLLELTAARRNRSIAYVTVAAPIDDAQESRLAADLTRRYGREVVVKVIVDPDVIGGISVQIGPDLYDATIVRRLAEARTALVR